jgi:hypothetical protein
VPRLRRGQPRRMLGRGPGADDLHPRRFPGLLELRRQGLGDGAGDETGQIGSAPPWSSSRDTHGALIGASGRIVAGLRSIRACSLEQSCWNVVAPDPSQALRMSASGQLG